MFNFNSSEAVESPLIVIKPSKRPPKLDEYAHLSEEAQKTIRALKMKYTLRINEISSSFSYKPEESRRSTMPPKDYYKHIYDATFKKENCTPVSVNRSSAATMSQRSKGFAHPPNFSVVDSSQVPIENSNEKNIHFHDGFKKSQRRPVITKSMWMDIEETNKTSNSPPLDLSQTSLFDEEEVICETPLPITLDESPITSKLCQNDFKQKLAPGRFPKKKEKTMDTKKLTEPVGQSLSNQTEDPLKNSNTHGQTCLKSSSSNFERSELCETSHQMNEKSAEKESVFSDEEVYFNLELPGFSPLICGKVNGPNNARESPIQLSQVSLPKELQESPFTFKINEAKQTDIFLEKDRFTDHNLKPSLKTRKLSPQNKIKRKAERPVFESDQESPINSHNLSQLKKATEFETMGSQKKMKSKFLPPTKSSTTAVHNTCITKKSIAPTEQRKQDKHPTVVDYLSLSQEEKQKAKAIMKSSKYLCLTSVSSNTQSLVNSFYTATEYAKKKSVFGKNDSSSSSPKSMMILTPNTICYELKITPPTIDAIRNILSSLMREKRCEKIIVNLKDFLTLMFKELNCNIYQDFICHEIHDPVIASWLLNPDQQPSSFTHLCQAAGLNFINGEWLSCLCVVPKMMDGLKKRLMKENLLAIYTKIEMKLIPLLACMECCSLQVNMKTFLRYSDIIKSKLRKLEETAFDTVGHKFSINSHPQLRQVLYEELKLDKKISSKSGVGKTSVAHHKSTSESALNIVAAVHPLPQIVLEYRSLQKMLSTYVEGLMACVVNGRISTHWDQTAAATGRLTSSHPNIQTVPKIALSIKDYKTTKLHDVNSTIKLFAREPFVSSEGHVFLAADFQQIELRILAHLSGEKTLLSMFWKPDTADIFNLLTSEWHDKSVDSVTTEDREQTKRVVYSVMYGVGKDRLSEYLKISPDSAKDIMQSFLVRFPCINSFSKKCIAYAEEHGYTETICGRKRYYPNIRSFSANLKAQAQRQAVNFCVQGSAADICKLAMLAVESKLSEHPELHHRLLLQIHDELVWEVSENQVFQIKDIIEGIMENTRALCSEFCDLQVPLTVSFSYGKSWAHLTSISSSMQSVDTLVDGMKQ